MAGKRGTNASYEPTLEEIAEATRLIREGWDERTELARRCLSNPDPVVPTVKSWSNWSDSSGFDTFYTGST